MILDKHWWNTEDGRLVPDGHPGARILAYPRLTEIPDATARQLGILVDGEPDEEPDEEPAEEAPGDSETESSEEEPAGKSRRKPADKSRVKPADKGGA